LVKTDYQISHVQEEQLTENFKQNYSYSFWSWLTWIRLQGVTEGAFDFINNG